MFDVIVEAKVFHFAKDFSLIAKIIIKTNIENIYTSQPYGPVLRWGAFIALLTDFIYDFSICASVFWLPWFDSCISDIL